MKVLDHLNFVGKINSRQVQYVEKFMMGWLVLQSKYSGNLGRGTLVNRLQKFLFDVSNMWKTSFYWHRKLCLLSNFGSVLISTLPSLAKQSRYHIILLSSHINFLQICLQVRLYMLSWILWIIATYCSLSSCSFGQALDKLQGKAVTHSCEVEWW